MTFEVPASVRAVRREWPPGSGRVALYPMRERALLHEIIRELEGLRHRPGCPGADADAFLAGQRDLEGCEFCRCANQADVFHELMMLDARIVPEPEEPEPEGVQIGLIDGDEFAAAAPRPERP